METSKNNIQGERTIRSLKNSIAGILRQLISMFIPFVIRTLMIQKMGVEYLGLNSLFSSVLQMLSLTELGFGSVMVYSMYKPVAEGDTKNIRALLYFYKKTYRIIGLIITVTGLVLMPNIQLFIASDYPEDINIYVIYAIYLLNTVVSYFIAAYKTSILIACLRSDIENNICNICNLLMYATQILVLLFFANYYIYVILLPLFTILLNLIRSIIVKRMYPAYYCEGNLTQNEKNEIIRHVRALIGHRIGGVFFSSVDNMVISIFLGLVVLGKYMNYYYIYTAVNGIVSVVFQSLISVIGNAMVCKSRSENYTIFNEMFLLNAFQTSFVTCCFLCLYQTFMKLWLGENYILSFSIVVLLSIYYFVSNIRRVVLGYKDAAGMWNDDFWKPYVSVSLNLLSNILLVKFIGLEGVVISSILALVLVEIPWETWVIFKKYFKMSIFQYYKRILEVVCVCVLSCVLTYLISNLLDDGIVGLFMRMILCLIIPNLIFIVVFRNLKEFHDAKNRLLYMIKGGINI